VGIYTLSLAFSFIVTIVLQEFKPAFFLIALNLIISNSAVDFSLIKAIFFILTAPLL